ncbi:MAG: HPr kinase/phosphorylase, partial [Ignavibacteriales bacterium]|nr:HPr kinase/phosphorylase [Ignavibacteriales bacterium]
MSIDKKAITKKDSIDVRFFFEKTKERFNLRLLSDESGFNRLIKDQNLHRPGLALAGFVGLFSYARVQVFGNTEMRYLKQLSLEQRRMAIERIFKFEIPCIILTDNNEPFPELIQLANENHIP